MPWLTAMVFDSKETREFREARGNREAREARTAREVRETRELREAREEREAREARELRELREIREAREAREQREMREVREAREAREARELRDIREAREAREQREALEMQSAALPAVKEIIVTPGLPDANSGKIYCLQVGSFSTTENAERTMRQLEAFGFNVVREWDGQLYRVLVTDIPAAMVYYAAQRLGALGIGHIWVRDTHPD